MTDQQFFKGACQTCGGAIEFPATADGMTVECPHCHQQTELRRVEKPTRNVTRLLVFAVAGLALAFGILFFLKSPGGGPVRSLPVVLSNAIPAIAEPARPKSPEDLKVTGAVSVEKAKGSRLAYVMGTLKNDSDHQRYGVRIELDLFDQNGNKLPAQANDYLQSLEPRKEWKFRALVLDAKAVSAKVAAIKEED